MVTQRLCDCGCLRPITAHPSAPHKRFATSACRTRWHTTQRQRAAQRLDEAATYCVTTGEAATLEEARQLVMERLRNNSTIVEGE